MYFSCDKLEIHVINCAFCKHTFQFFYRHRICIKFDTWLCSSCTSCASISVNARNARHFNVQYMECILYETIRLICIKRLIDTCT